MATKEATSTLTVGSIIMSGSTAGYICDPAFRVYGASKAVIRQMARNWIFDLKGAGIRVNILSPGFAHTPAYDYLFGENIDAVLEYAKNITPLGRVGTVEEIANAVMYLASDESSYINGIELFGGLAQI